MEQQGGGIVAMASLPRNLTQHPLSLSSHHPPSLPLLSTQLPSASYHGNRRGAENEGRREVCRLEAKSNYSQQVCGEDRIRFAAPVRA